MLGEDRAQILGGPVPVVGQGLDEDGDAAGGVPLVEDLLEVRSAGVPAAASDGALDRVARHPAVLGALDRVGQGRVVFGVGAALPGVDLDRADQLREELPTLRVDLALLLLDAFPV